MLGGSLGIAASSATLGAKAREELALAGMPFEMFAGLALEPSRFSTDQRLLIRRLYMDALRRDMIVCCAVLALGVVCTLWTYRRYRMSIEHMMQMKKDEYKAGQQCIVMDGLQST